MVCYVERQHGTSKIRKWAISIPCATVAADIFLDYPQELTQGTYYLPHLLNMPDSNTQICNRFLRLVNCMIRSENDLMRFVAKHGLQNKDTVIGHNIAVRCRNSKSNVHELLINHEMHPGKQYLF